MSLIFLDGGDTGVPLANRYGLSGDTANWVVTAARNGNGWRCNSADGGSNNSIADIASVSLASDGHATLTCGFAFDIKEVPTTDTTAERSRASFLELLGDSGMSLHLVFTRTSGGNLAVYRGLTVTGGALLGSTAASFVVGTFRYVEIQAVLHDTTGSLKIWVDGELDLDLTNIDTKNGGTGTVFDTVRFVMQTNSGYDGPIFDDFYITNGAGSAPYNGNLGDIKIETLLPDGDGATTDFTPLTGPSNFTEVDEATPDDATSYVESSTDGNIDLYTYGNLTTTAGDVRGVQVTTWAKAEGSADTMRALARPSTTNHAGSDDGVGTGAYAQTREIWETDPEALADWTIASVNGSQFGVENRP